MARLILLTLLLIKISTAAIQAPFDPGFSMGNLSTINIGTDYTGRDPWSSALFFDDTIKISGAFYTTAFHSTISEDVDDKLLELGVGGVLSIKKWLVIKVGVSRFTAFKLYYEQNERISLATRAIPIFTPAINFSVTKAGMQIEDNSPNRVVIADFGVKANFDKLSTAIFFKNFTIYDDEIVGLTPHQKLEFGVYSKENRFGAQGVKLEIILQEDEQNFSFSIGEQVRLFKYFYASIAFKTYPLSFAFGLTVPLKRITSEVSFVQMGWLGWSQSFAAEWR